MNTLTKIDHALAKVEEVLLALLLIGLVVLAAVQVLLRNIWSTSIDWADLTLQNATVLIGLLGAAVATSEGRHLNIDIFGRALKGRQAFVLRVVIGVFAVYICSLLTVGGWQTFQVNFTPWKANLPEGWSMMRMLRQELGEGSFPQWLSQMLLPAGFALIGVHFLLRLFRDIGTLISGVPWEGSVGEELEGDAYLDQMMSYAEGGEADETHQAREGEAAQDEADTLAAEAEDDDEAEEGEEAATAFDPKLQEEMARKAAEASKADETQETQESQRHAKDGGAK